MRNFYKNLKNWVMNCGVSVMRKMDNFANFVNFVMSNLKWTNGQMDMSKNAMVSGERIAVSAAYISKTNREWFENGTEMVRVLSRNGSRNSRHSLDSILSRICLVSLILIVLGGFTTEVWGNTVGSANSSSDVQNGKIVMGGNHATFTFGATDSHSISYTGGVTNAYKLGQLDHNSSRNFTFTWSGNSGCTVKVTNISFDIRAYSSSEEMMASFYGDGPRRINNLVGGNESFSASNANGLTSGITLTISNTCKGHKHSFMGATWYTYDDDIEFYIKNISITFTITPNKPGVSPTTETVNVTLPANTANPTTINYQDNFTTSDHYGSYFEYAFDSNPNSKGVMSGSNFYATEAGTYKIKARIKALANCHEASSWSSNLTITVNPLTPSFNAANGSVDISYAGSVVTTDLRTLISGYNGNSTSLTFTKVSASNGGDVNKATIASDGYSFSATQLGTYTLKATYGSTKQYSAVEKTFTVTVGKRTPTFEWDEYEHIYASDVLENVAQAKYGNADVDGLTYTYTSGNTGVVVVDGTTLRVQQTGFNTAQDVKIKVKTDETAYYKEGKDSIIYHIEPKATPVFKLNGVDLPESPVQRLDLLIGETAAMAFEGTDESNGRFTYPVAPFAFVRYSHDSENHTGIITGIEQGDKTIQFHQTGTSTIFDHTRSVHVYVHKHADTLTTTLDGGTWLVDSVYTGNVYGVKNTPTGSEPAQESVTVTSSNEKVLKLVDGHWKAVGAGTAILTIAQANNDYWTGDTITATITVIKHTPVFTWHIPTTVNWNRTFAHPVSSTNEDEGCTFSYSSNNTSAINYVNGALRTYEKDANNVRITVTQQGNYKWATYDSTFYVNVEKMANHVEFTVDSVAMFNAVNGGGEGSVSYTDEGIRLGGSETGNTSGPAWNWSDKYIDIVFEGVPRKISFSTGLTKWSATSNVVWPGSGNNNGFWYVIEYSATGAEHTVWSENDSSNPGDVEKDLLPSTNKVRICYTGNFAGFVKNLKITERTEITGANTVDFGAMDAGSNPTNKTVKINWYNVDPLTLTIEGTNASQFSVSPTTIASEKDSYAENVALTVSYKHDRASAKDTATLVISDGTTTKRIGLKGVTNKVTPAITWQENLTPMQRGVGVKHPATSPVTLVYTSTDSAVVNVIGDSIVPLKKGNARITASFDGTSDAMYNSNSSYIDVLVTDVKVQHINWTQNFKRLKWTDDATLSAKNTPDFPLVATVSYYDVDKMQEITIERPITFTSNNTAVVQILNDTMIHVVGTGTTTLEAHVDGIADSLYEATAIRDVVVREPSSDCEEWVLDDASGSIAVINEVIFDLDGEADSIYFEAWREIIKIVFEFTGGDLYLAEVYEDGSEKNIWNNETPLNTPQSYKCPLSRDAKKVRFYTTVGATGYHNFGGVYARRARYVEFEDGAATKNIAFTTEEAKPGVAKTKTFTVNYSNITDQLEFEFKGGKNSKFSVVSPAAIGTECGDHGQATVTVQFMSNDVDTYKDTLLIHNLNQTLTVYLTAEVDKHHQQITWNPETSLKTTDEVTFNAVTSAAGAGLTVRYSVTDGAGVASVNATTGKLTIIKDGSVTIQADADGDGTTYYDADQVSYTFNISKVKPSITAPTAATMTLPDTRLGDCTLSGGSASVAGSFAWDDENTYATYNNSGYKVVFTPDNTNWYDTASCVVVVPVDKIAQVITWNFDVTKMYCNAAYSFTGENAATVNSPLTVSYETSDETIAYVDEAKNLRIVKGGEVTITARCAGNDLYQTATPVAKTFIIHRMAPTIVTLPTATPMKIGRLLSDASLTGGRAELNGGEVEGGFAWKDGNTTVENVAGSFTRTVIFTPANSNYYDAVDTTMTVAVEKYAPIVTADLHATDIDYGQTLSQSQLSGTIIATDTVKIPSDSVSGTYAWKEESAVLNAGTQKATVVFVPANMDWYEAVEFPVTVNVHPATANYAGVAEMALGQSLNDARLINMTTGVNGEEVLGYVDWDESVDLSVRPELNDTRTFAIVFTPVYGSNYAPGSGVCSLRVNEGFVFNGDATDATNWNNSENWVTGHKPDVTDHVVISANVDIAGNVIVGGMTINAGTTVTVKSGSTLTLGAQSSFYRAAYGDIHVEEGGHLILHDDAEEGGMLDVNNLYLDAALGGRSSSTNDFIYAKSAQVNNVGKMNVHADAYFDVALDPNGACTQGWYDFTVPFPVDVMTGVARFQNDVLNTNLRNEVNYAIMSYHEDIAANRQYGWKKYRGVMQPGVCYTMTIDDYYNVYRFHKVSGVPLTNTTTVVMTATEGTGGPENRGWNCIGNGSFNYAELVADGIEKVQVFDHYTNSYSTISISDKAFIVGSTFFVQAVTDNSTMTYSPQVRETMYAPNRVVGREISEFLLHLTREGQNTYSDALYLSASEDAVNSYTAGRELSKFGTSTKLAQIWADAYGLKLCDVEAPLVNDQAIIPISLYAPTTATYTLDAVQMPNDASLYLMYEGAVVWNLSQSAYTLDLTRGTTTGYSLLLMAEAPSVTTGADAVSGEEAGQVEKIILNGKLYILRDGEMYDATGKKIK